jgi:phage terminase large subunit-like protein
MDDLDTQTKLWIRNESDRIAVKNGCRFDLALAQYAVNWIEANCYLWEGVPANTKITLEDWQYDFVMRLFGWVRPMQPNEPHYDKPEGRRWCRRFTKASVWIPKKNAKSATLAAVGLFLLMADGEPGQKIYVAARDGKQALIPQQNAINMLDGSPTLRIQCGVNKSTRRITHPASRSFMDVVSGDNRKSQEGLNGSVLVDEIHVCHAELMSILEGAGISRAEPLQIEVSTAGNDCEGYGKKQFDKCLEIIAGTEIDQAFLGIIYAAPQDLSFTDLDADPAKYGKMANPAWGRLVNEVEFMAHYQRAKRSITDLLNFMMYRLNIWQRSSNPWLKMGDWSKCQEAFSDADLVGLECRGAALDMARVNDMAALALIFRHPTLSGHVRARVYMFWPEEVAKDHCHEAPFLEWARDGHLILTPGNTIDISFVRSFIIERHGATPFAKLAYDEWNADGLTQELADGAKDHHGNAVTEGLGIERVPFPQTIKNFSQPTELFESMVIEGKFRHNGNPCLTWQAGHVQVARDTNGNKRPTKPDGKKESVKKIDGIIAAVMALAIYQEPPPSEPGIFILD